MSVSIHVITQRQSIIRKAAVYLKNLTDTEVSDFDHSTACDQKVIRFNVPMDNILLIEKIKN